MGTCGRVCAVFAVVLAVLCGVCIQKGRPNSDHLPELMRPYRPLHFAMVNGFAKLIGAEPVQLPSEESLKAQACQRAKLPAGVACEFDMPGEPADWKEGFQLWRKSASEEGGLNFIGSKILEEVLVDALTMRVRQIHAWRKMPELESTTIDRPIFILGMHRTGTTLLFNLVSKAEGIRSPRHWEYVGLPHAIGSSAAEAREDARKKVDLKMSLVPGMEHMHHLDVDMPEECIFQMMQSFAGYVPMVVWNGTSHTQHMLKKSLDVSHAVRHHRRHLQWLQTTAGDEKPRRWVLKAPHWALMIEDIEKIYPDAHFIFTHRAPHRSMGSSSSMVAKWRTIGSDEMDLEKFGPEQVAYHEEMIARVLAARRRWKADPAMASRVYDVYLSDLTQDPVGTVDKAWEHFGMEKLSGESRAAMQKWLESGQVHAGKHPFELKDFGISKEGILASPVFKDYCQEFKIPEC